MENNFTKIMQQRSDAELIKITTIDRLDYQPEAVQAADLEIKNRNIDFSKIEEVHEQLVAEKEIKQALESNIVSSLIRFVNYTIDLTIYLISIFIISFLYFSYSSDSHSLFIVVFGVGLFPIYYIYMEFNYQKTVGKYVTKTKVVMKNGQKPTLSAIVIRTFCRLIPFDNISFVFTKNGFHDYLSKTTVVKESISFETSPITNIVNSLDT